MNIIYGGFPLRLTRMLTWTYKYFKIFLTAIKSAWLQRKSEYKGFWRAQLIFEVHWE